MRNSKCPRGASDADAAARVVAVALAVVAVENKAVVEAAEAENEVAEVAEVAENVSAQKSTEPGELHFSELGS